MSPAGTDEHAGEEPAPSTSLGFQMWLVTLSWQRTIRAALHRHDLTHVQFVLLAGTWWLSDHGGEPTQTQLVEHTRIDPMMTSQVLRRLEDKGLVERSEDIVDTRAKRVCLTDEGRALLIEAMPDVHAADAAFFAPVSSARLLEMLTRLAHSERDER